MRQSCSPMQAPCGSSIPYNRLHSSWGALLVLGVVSVVYILSPVHTSFDSKFTIPFAWSIVAYGDTDLNRYQALFDPSDDYRLTTVKGRVKSFFPEGPMFLAVPVVLALKVAGVSEAQVLKNTKPIEKIAASLVMGIFAAIMFLVACRLLSLPYALLIAFLAAFCTPAWSTASRAMWQHGPSMLMLAATLWIFLRARENPSSVQYAGLTLALAYVMRPTNSISLAFLSLYVLLYHRRFFLKYLLWGGMVAVPWGIWNMWTYDALLPPYFAMPRLNLTPEFEALLGNLFSPARGLLVFSPVFLFSFYGLWLELRGAHSDMLDLFLIGIIVAHWLVISSFGHWWAGYSFGPRFFSDITPYFVYFLIPVVKRLTQLQGFKKLVVSTFFLLSIAVSFFVHCRGATSWEVYSWNSQPVDVDNSPQRLWDWSDLSFLRGVSGKRIP